MTDATACAAAPCFESFIFRVSPKTETSRRGDTGWSSALLINQEERATKWAVFAYDRSETLRHIVVMVIVKQKLLLLSSFRVSLGNRSNFKVTTTKNLNLTAGWQTQNSSSSAFLHFFFWDLRVISNLD
jgi:hypothetical protein